MLESQNERRQAMKMKLLWGTLLVGFGALNIYGFVASDLAGLVAYFKNLGPWGIVATADLMIALLIGISWMWRDARAKGLSALPYIVLAIATGSIGLLAYLVRHGDSAGTV
jgi:uncharacterized membrane protein